MKKTARFLTFIAAFTMLFATCTTALAAPSPNAQNASAQTLSSNALSISSVSVSAGGVALSVAAADPVFVANVQEVAKSWFAASMGGSVTVQKAFDIQGTITGPTDIQMSVPGITAGQKVGVIHLTSGGQWENLPVTKVGSGYVTATFTSLSPVAIVVSGESPKTGQAIPLAGIISIIAAMGAVFCFLAASKRNGRG